MVLTMKHIIAKRKNYNEKQRTGGYAQEKPKLKHERTKS